MWCKIHGNSSFSFEVIIICEKKQNLCALQSFSFPPQTRESPRPLCSVLTAV